MVQLKKNGYLVTGSDDNSIKIWDIINHELVFIINETNGGHVELIRHLLDLSNGWLASCSWDKTIKIWEF